MNTRQHGGASRSSRSGFQSSKRPVRRVGKFNNSSFPKPKFGKPARTGGFNSRPSFRAGGGRSGGKNRSKGARLDFSRFVKKAEFKQEAPYVAKHTFSDFPFGQELMQNVSKKGYIHPRPIQDQTIMETLAGRDIFGLANTGTGKTAAFLLPLIDKVFKDRTGKVLILAPTRELAMQIEQEFRELSYGMRLFGVSVVGGMPINKQITEIKRGVNFVIGTPGRVTDLIKRKVLDLAEYRYFVLDEADRMMDMGFINDMHFVAKHMPAQRQTLFFSATLSPEIKKLTHEFLKDPIFVSVITGETSKNVDQDIVRVSKENKFETLCKILHDDGSDKVLIFREMKYAVNDLERDLRAKGFKVGAIHGDKRSRERIRTLDAFKQNKLNILIATDVAARGLDIPDVSHVINYDIPESYDTYVHRIGRTGRGDQKGTSLTFVPA